MTLLYLSLAWILGVFLGAEVSLGPALGVIALLSLFAFLLRHQKGLLLPLLFLLALLGGLLRGGISIPSIDEYSLEFYNYKEVKVLGVVSGDPEPREGWTDLRLAAREVMVAEKRIEVSGDVLVHAPAIPSIGGDLPPRDFPYYRYGDLLKVEGKLETPPRLEEFDYREYLARKGIGSILRVLDPGKIEFLAGGQGFKPLEGVYLLRGSLSQALGEALPEPQGALAQALLLGQRGTLPQEVKEAFNRTGTAHLLAISGLHFSILIGLLVALGIALLGRHRPYYFILGLGVILIYTLLTGMRPPVVRAAIMGSLWLIADYIGRPGSAFTSLLFAAALMVGVHPPILGDVAFQLSFAAMAGLIAITPRFQPFLRRLVGNFLGDSLSVTLGALLATLPLIAFYFQRVSPVTLPANLLALPSLPGIIITSALVGLLGLLAPPLAQVLGWVAWLFLSYLMEVVKALSSLPFASWEIHVSAPMVWGYYALLIGALWLGMSWGRFKATHLVQALLHSLGRLPPKGVLLSLVVLAALVWTAALALPDNRLRVSFLDVGQGDAILLSRGSQQVLIDGGPNPQALYPALGERMPFWDRTIELVVLTHPHEDHVEGLVGVLRRYQVKMVLEGGAKGEEEASPPYQEWLRLLGEKGIEPIQAKAGQRIELGPKIWLEVLHPPASPLEGTGSDMDNNSTVLRLVAGEVSFLFTADLYDEGERYLLYRGVSLEATVLKVGHHGSATSTSPEFLEEVAPQVAVISVGAQNPFGHPSPQVIERLSGVKVYRTDEQGTIDLLTDGHRLWVKGER